MILHVILVNLDEHFFNKKRSHGRLEIISVITDGVFYLLPILMATFISYKQEYEIIYKSLGAVSMISIIKNEWFYKGLDRLERLTHAALYVLHPILLFTFFESWQNNYFEKNPNFWMFQLVYIGLGVKSVTYQLIYWNYIHENPK